MLNRFEASSYWDSSKMISFGWYLWGSVSPWGLEDRIENCIFSQSRRTIFLSL